MDEKTQSYIATLQDQWAESLKIANDRAAYNAVEVHYLKQEKQGLMEEIENLKKELNEKKQENKSKTK